MTETRIGITAGIKERSKELDQYVLTKQFEHFVRKWAPQARQSEFDADLFMLVRAIQQDAAKPYEAAMSSILKYSSGLANLIPPRSER
ncbi:hypothetical protein HGO34_15590 [Agrobacterium vitis]|uniref:hypothetical protein n=1 Tax=Agrobacterium vitis TaxID=373 RepID=UPI002033BB13|nr:hypothetical protein [Agrobacterium vitis]MCM2441144.1 hypothetical protein [Agrobacterium vitis]